MCGIDVITLDLDGRPFRAWSVLWANVPGRCPGLTGICAVGAWPIRYIPQPGRNSCSIAALQRLKKSLMQNLLTGRIRLPVAAPSEKATA